MSEQLLSRAEVRLVTESVNEEKRTVDYVLSDDSVDSYGEIVEQKWRLERFKRNPVVLFSHNRPTGGGLFGGGSLTQEETLPIGRVIGKLRIEGNKAEGKRLVGTVEFAPEELNPFAEKVFRMVAAGYMKGGSVGFYPHDVRKENRDDVERHILSDNELFEFSITPLPANANALANAAESRAERVAYLERRCAECEERATWSASFINRLPDVAFAIVKPGGKKDEDGKTFPRELRMLPHHTAEAEDPNDNDSVDMAHLKAARSRVEQPDTDLNDSQRARARSHLNRHWKALTGEKSLDTDDDQTASDGLEINTMDEEQFKAKIATLEAANTKALADATAATELAQAAETKAAELTAGLESARAELATKTAEVETLTKSVGDLTVERDAALTAKDALENQLVTLECTSLVGVKFHKAELEDQIEDRKRLGPEKYAARMANRAPLHTTTPKLPEDTTPPEQHTDTSIPGEKTSAYLETKAG